MRPSLCPIEDAVHQNKLRVVQADQAANIQAFSGQRA